MNGAQETMDTAESKKNFQPTSESDNGRAANDRDVWTESPLMDRFVQALFSDEPRDGMAHDLSPEDCSGVFATVARHYYLQLTSLIADQQEQYRRDLQEPMDLSVTPTFFLQETRGAALRLALFVPHGESRDIADQMEVGEERALLAFDQAVAHFTKATQFATWIPIATWGQDILVQARLEDQAISADASAFSQDVIGALAPLGYRFREDLDAILAEVVEVAPDELFSHCRRCGIPTIEDRGEDRLLGVNIDALFLCDDCLTRALIRPPVPGRVVRPAQIAERLGLLPLTPDPNSTVHTDPFVPAGADNIVNVRLPAHAAARLGDVTINLGGITIRSMQARNNVELEVTTRRLVAQLSDSTYAPTHRGSDGVHVYQLPRPVAEKWLGMITLYIASHQRNGQTLDRAWQRVLPTIAASFDAALVARTDTDGWPMADRSGTPSRSATPSSSRNSQQPFPVPQTSPPAVSTPPSTQGLVSIVFDPFIEDTSEIRRWIAELRHERQRAADDTHSTLCLLARWELRAVAALGAQLNQSARALTARSEVLTVGRNELSALAWLVVYARRHQQRLNVNATQLARIAASVWEQMEMDNPHIVAMPRRLANAVIRDGVASINSLKRIGAKPPGDDDGWTERFEPVISHALDTGISHQPDEYLVIECTVEDIAKMAGLALGNYATTSDPQHRADAAATVWHLTQSTTFEWADHLNSQLGALNPTARNYAGYSTSAPVPLALSLLCSYCGTRFTSAVPRCPACHARLEHWIDHLNASGVEAPESLTSLAEAVERMPEPVPWRPVIIGSIIAFVIAFITFYIRWESGNWLILAFPAAIGGPAGFVAACLAINRTTLFRPYYWVFPVVIGCIAYASTFWLEYEFTVDALEDLGYVNVREQLPPIDFLNIKADEPISISRRGQEIESGEGNAGQSVALWAVEAAVAGGAGYYGWRRGVRQKHGIEPESAA